MERNHLLRSRVHVFGLVFMMLAAAIGAVGAVGQSFIGNFNNISTVSTTVPVNGDVNPYGVALVPVSKDNLVAGDFLISNFNNSNNQQGTGTTIVEIAPNGTFSLFAQINLKNKQCPGGVGLTTALVALRSGIVIVGSLPTKNGKSATANAGCLIVLDSNGNVIETITDNFLNGPWDMTAVDNGSRVTLFVTNVLNGTVAAKGNVVNGGTVVRITLAIRGDDSPEVLNSTIIGANFPERTDPNALVIGPTGVAFDPDSGTLYVADSLNNRIAAISNALSRIFPSFGGQTVSQGGALNDPLGLALTPNNHLVAANGNDGNIVEVDPATGNQVAEKLVDNTGGPPPGAGALFGLIAVPGGVYFVDDAFNTFNLLD